MEMPIKAGADDLWNVTSSYVNSTAPQERDEFTKNPLIRGIFVLFYCVIFLLGLSGNSLVVFVVLRNKSMQTITNIFITNLAVSDIMMCLFAVPFTPLSAFMRSWIFGDALCHILPMTLGVSVYVSTLTSTAIAIDRYFVIVHPFKPRMKVFVCMLLIVAIWIISISISLPLAIYQIVMWVETDQAYACHEHWPGDVPRQFFTVTSLILQYIVPCSIISFCYFRVSMVLRVRAKNRIGSGSNNREREEQELKRKRRTNKMLIAMIAIFVVCWLPLNIMHITADFRHKIVEFNYYVFLFFIAHVIAMSSTIYNPFLYAWMNENFKKEFRSVLPFFFTRPGGRHQRLNGSASQYTTVETQHTVINRSPAKERNGNEMKNPSPQNAALYTTDSEKVHLQMSVEEEEC